MAKNKPATEVTPEVLPVLETAENGELKFTATEEFIQENELQGEVEVGDEITVPTEEIETVPETTVEPEVSVGPTPEEITQRIDESFLAFAQTNTEKLENETSNNLESGTPTPTPEIEQLGFEYALALMKAGHTIGRGSWHGGRKLYIRDGVIYDKREGDDTEHGYLGVQVDILSTDWLDLGENKKGEKA